MALSSRVCNLHILQTCPPGPKPPLLCVVSRFANKISCFAACHRCCVGRFLQEAFSTVPNTADIRLEEFAGTKYMYLNVYCAVWIYCFLFNFQNITIFCYHLTRLSSFGGHRVDSPIVPVMTERVVFVRTSSQRHQTQLSDWWENRKGTPINLGMPGSFVPVSERRLDFIRSLESTVATELVQHNTEPVRYSLLLAEYTSSRLSMVGLLGWFGINEMLSSLHSFIGDVMRQS